MRRIVFIALIVISANCFGAIGVRFGSGAWASGTTGTCNWASGSNAEGNTLVLFGTAQSATSEITTLAAGTTDTNWQIWNFHDATNSVSLAVGLLRHAAFGHASISVTYSVSSKAGVTCGEYANLEDFDAIAVAATHGSSGTLTIPTLTTNYTNGLTIGYCGVVATSTTLTTGGSGYTSETVRPGASQSEAFEAAVTSPGSQTPTSCNSTVSGNYMGITLALYALTSKGPNWPVSYRIPSTTALVTSTNFGADQGFTRSATRGWTTACFGGGATCPSTANQFLISAFNLDAHGLPTGSSVDSRDCSIDAAANGLTHVQQCNGLYYKVDTDELYVGVTDYPFDSNSWIFVYNASNLAAGITSFHAVDAQATEGTVYYPRLNMFIVYYFNVAAFRLYSTSWVAGPWIGCSNPVSDAGANAWQSFTQDGISDNFYANPHCNNADHNVYSFSITGSGVTISCRKNGTFAQYINSGTGNGTCQGTAIYGNGFYSADRQGLDGPVTVQQFPPPPQSNWWAQ